MEQIGQLVAQFPTDQVLGMISPGWVLAILLTGLNISIFQSVAGRDAEAAWYFVPAGVFGFALGNLLAVLAGSPLPVLGDVHAIEASALAWLALSVTNARVPA